MPKVTFLPVNRTVEGTKGESVLDVALNHDVPIQHACGGFCACTTCHIIVKSDGAYLEPQEDEEKERIEQAGGFPPGSRLACQSKLLDQDITVEIQNLD